MSISQTLKDYLDCEHVHYDVLPHPQAYRAALVAQSLRTPTKGLAKVVVVKVEQRRRATATIMAGRGGR